MRLTGYMLRCSRTLCVASAKRSGTAWTRDVDVMFRCLATGTTGRAPRLRRRAAPSFPQTIEGTPGEIWRGGGRPSWAILVRVLAFLRQGDLKMRDCECSSRPGRLKMDIRRGQTSSSTYARVHAFPTCASGGRRGGRRRDCERRSGRRARATASCVHTRCNQDTRKVLSTFQRGALRCACAAMHSVGRIPANLYGHGKRSLHRGGLESHLTQARGAVYDVVCTSQETTAAGRRKERRKAAGASQSRFEHSVRRTHAASSRLRKRRISVKNYISPHSGGGASKS